MYSMSSCNKDDDSTTAGEDTVPSHTSLVYMVADNSLYSYATSDFEEIKEGYSEISDTSKYSLLVYIDDYSKPRLLHITKKKGKVVADTLKAYSEQNSLDVDIMAAIINTALNAYPADSYGLTLWSHGNGWLPGTDQSGDESETKAFGEDLDNNSNSDGVQMDILDLKTALHECPHFGYIVFDACEMQGIEVAYELKSCTDYIIASPGEISAFGAPYDDMVPAFFTRENTAEAIAGAYYQYYAEHYSYSASNSGIPGNNGGVGGYTGGTASSSDYTYGIAISVVNCCALENLASATTNILISYITESSEIGTSSVFSYDQNYYNFYYDLNGFIQSLTSEDENYTTWKEAFDEAVPVFLTTAYIYSSYANDGEGGMVSMKSASGISTYIPNNSNYYDAYYWAYYLMIAKASPRYSYLTDVIEEYRTSYNEYYKEFSWDTDAGWSSIGW